MLWLAKLGDILDTPVATHLAADFNYITRGKALDNEKQWWALLHMPDDRWLASYPQLLHQLVEIFAFDISYR